MIALVRAPCQKVASSRLTEFLDYAAQKIDANDSQKRLQNRDFRIIELEVGFCSALPGLENAKNPGEFAIFQVSGLFGPKRALRKTSAKKRNASKKPGKTSISTAAKHAFLGSITGDATRKRA
jgi:hypothetical protein